MIHIYDLNKHTHLAAIFSQHFCLSEQLWPWCIRQVIVPNQFLCHLWFHFIGLDWLICLCAGQTSMLVYLLLVPRNGSHSLCTCRSTLKHWIYNCRAEQEAHTNMIRTVLLIKNLPLYHLINLPIVKKIWETIYTYTLRDPIHITVSSVV